MKSVVIATKKGMVLRCSEEEFRITQRGTRGVKAISLREDDQVVSSLLCSDGDVLMVFSKKGHAIRFKIEDIRLTQRTGTGVRLMILPDNDEVACMIKGD